MKKKIFQFSSHLGKMIVMPLVLMAFFVLTSSTVNAQTFKSVDDAGLTVKLALEDLSPFVTSGLTAEQKLKAAKARVFMLFNQEINNAVSTQAAYNVVVSKLNGFKMSGNSAAITNSVDPFILSAKDELLELITS